MREQKRFLRYVFAVQYNGTPFLGFSYQGANGENCITDAGIDLRGWYSVEGKLRNALHNLVNNSRRRRNHEHDNSNFENFQVSSRTDRGVHALKNTFHVDIRPDYESQTMRPWKTHQLLRGMNYYLKRDNKNKLKTPRMQSRIQQQQQQQQQQTRNPSPILTGNEIRIVSCQPAPLEMIENKHFNPNYGSGDDIDGDINDAYNNQQQPSHISWNARFTATKRTYVYKILCHSIPTKDFQDQQANINNNNDNDSIIMEEFGVPFEDQWSWRVLHQNETLNISEMKAASQYMTGTHDFTSFRGKNCSRSSPIVTIENIAIDVQPTFDPMMNGLYQNTIDTNTQLVTIAIQGDAFLYRQVRNMVGCLVEVGKNKLSSHCVKDILMARDRRKAGKMAPAHGLYLANVEHSNLVI